MKNIEILLFVILLLISIILCFLNVKRKALKGSAFSLLILLIFMLITLFVGIHLLFYYQVGFPASKNQAEKDLLLSSSDWLSFLGNYLGFSGSLVMAFIVYRQSKIIDELTISEYKPSISISIKSCNKSTEYKKDVFKDENILQVLPNASEPFYTYHCDLEDDGKKLNIENYSILLFVEIYNLSKSRINQFSFKYIDFKSNDEQYKYINRGGNWDPADNLTQIFPGKMLKRCFLINRIPENLGLCWMVISFTDEENRNLEQRFLVSKRKNGILSFLNISEPC